MRFFTRSFCCRCIIGVLVLWATFGARAQLAHTEARLYTYEAGKGPLGYTVFDELPLFSPDGRYVAFMRRFKGTRRDEIWLLAPLSGVCAPLAEGSGGYRDFEWDALDPVVGSNEPNAPEEARGNDAYPYFVTRLSDGALIYGWVWIPQFGIKKQMKRLDRAQYVLEMPAAGGVPIVGAASAPLARRRRYPSPNGSYVAFTHDGKSYLRVRADPLFYGSEPSDNSVTQRWQLFASNSSGAWKRVWGKRQRIRLGSLNIVRLRWDPGKTDPTSIRFAFQTRDPYALNGLLGNTDLYIVDSFDPMHLPSKLTVRSLWATDGAESTPSWSPDGRFIAYYDAYLSGGGQRWDLNLLEVNEQSQVVRQQQIEKNVYGGSPDARGARWAGNPNTPRQWLVYVSGDNREMRVLEVGATLGDIQTLPNRAGGEERAVIKDVDVFLFRRRRNWILRVAYAASVPKRAPAIYVEEWKLKGDRWTFADTVMGGQTP